MTNNLNSDCMAIYIYCFCSEELEKRPHHISGGVEVSVRLPSKLESVAGRSAVVVSWPSWFIDPGKTHGKSIFVEQPSLPVG